MDLAALFCRLFDSLDLEPFLDGSVRRQIATADHASRAIEEAVLAQRFSTTDVERRLEAGELNQAEHLRLVVGLDRVFAHMHPFLAGTQPLPSELAEIRDRYIERGHYGAPGVPGQLLPRIGSPGAARLRLEKPVDALRFVIRVPEEALVSVRLLHLGSDGADGSSISRRELSVACAPGLASYDEMMIAATGTGAAPAYRLGPKSEELRRRISALLRGLDDSGAVLGVLPEATLDNAVLEGWQETIAATRAPDTSNLRWILCGTGPVGESSSEAPPNRAVVLDRDDPANPVWLQDKRHRFTLEPAYLSEWKLEGLLGQKRTTEDIHLGTHTVVAETALGRIAITVCEDLARLAEVKPSLDACGVSLVITPVFSKELRQHFWEDSAGKQYIGDGATLVVCNSLAVIHARDLKAEVDTDGRPLWGTSFARSQDSFELAHGSKPTDVSVLQFPIRLAAEDH